MRYKHAIVVCAAFLIAPAAHAQFIRGYGVKAGAVAASQSWDYTSDLDISPETRWGYDFGLFVEAINVPFISLLVEMHYVQKGFSMSTTIATATNPTGFGTMTTRPRLDYLSIPLLAKVRFGMGALTPFVAAGPRYDLLVNREAEGVDAVYDKLKNTDAGITVAAGFELSVPLLVGLSAEARYSPSFDDIYHTDLLTVKNKSFEFLLGVRF